MPKLIFDNRTPHPKILFPSGGRNFTTGANYSSGKTSSGNNVKLTNKLSAYSIEALQIACPICFAFKKSKCRSKAGVALTGIHTKRVKDFYKKRAMIL